MKHWLPLSDYSTKYKVSISTLRRRIKSEKAIYRFEEGKYLLKDAPLKEHKNSIRTVRPESSFAPPQRDEELRSRNSEATVVVQPINTPGLQEPPGPFLTAAQEMLGELKKAYRVILQEKEEQVLLLKDEVADLRTLVGVLEEENNRLKSQMSDSFKFDNWLSTEQEL